MKIWMLALTLLLATFSLQAQVHPYVAGGAILNGSGQDNAGAVGVGGVQFDTKHLFSYSEAGYETGGKTNDNSNVSSSGHMRYLSDETLARFGDWYVGPGIGWSKLYTPAYSKSSVHPRFTFGHQFHNPYVNRVLVSYVHPGTDKVNGVQGFEASAWWTGKHMFLRMLVGGYWDHNTVIPVGQGGSPASVASELASKSLTSQFQTVLGWRF